MPCCCGGKKKTKQELEDEQHEKDLLKCYNKDQIYIDAAGNFRYGEKKNDPEYELSVIVDKDDQVEEVCKQLNLSTLLYLYVYIVCIDIYIGV